MVFGLGDLSGRRQYLIKVAAPARRVVARRPITPHGSPVEHAFDAPSDPARGFGLVLPDRLDAFEYQAGIDRSDRQCADLGERIGLQCREDLRTVFAVLPLRFVLLVESLRRLGERERLGRSQPLCSAFVTAGVERVDLVGELLALPLRPPAASRSENVNAEPRPIKRARPLSW